MAKTLSEAGGQTNLGSMPTSTEITQSSGFKATQHQAGNSLAKDLMGVMNSAGQVAQESYQLSTSAAKRAATDSLSKMSVAMSMVESQITPDTDLRKVEEANRAIYQEFSNRIFDNEDAQRAYDDMFQNSALPTVAKKNSALEQAQLKRDADDNVKNTLMGIEAMGIAGVDMTPEFIETATEVMTAGGYYKKEDVEYLIADRATTTFKSKTVNGYSAVLKQAGFNEDSKWDLEMKRNVFKNEFGAWGNIDKNGKVVFNQTIDNKAQEEILRAWSTMDSALSSGGKDPVNEKYFRAKASSTDTTSNATTNYVPPAEQEANIAQSTQAFVEADEYFPLSDTQKKDRNITLAKAKNRLNETLVIENDIMYSNPDDVRGYLASGRELVMHDVVDGKDKTVKISASDYKKAYDYMLDASSGIALNTKIVDEKSRQAFMKAIEDTRRYELLGGGTSAVTKKYNPVMNTNTATPVFTPNEIYQFIEYERIAGKTDPNRLDKSGVLNTIDSKLQELDPNDKNFNLKASQTFSRVIDREKNTRKSEKQSSLLDAQVSKYLTDLSSGKLRQFSFFDGNVAHGSEEAIKQYIVNSNRPSQAVSVMNSLDFFDYGDTLKKPWGELDERVVLPLSANEKDMRNAIDKLRTDYKAAKLDRSDIVFSVDYDADINNFSITVRRRDDESQVLGTITAKNSVIISKKIEDEEE